MAKRKSKKVWFESLLAGEWFRGTDAKGKGVGVAYMGSGVYLTWMRGVAEAFAKLAVDASGKGPPKIHSYHLKPGLKILDNKSALMVNIKRELGVSPWDKIDSPLFSKILAARVQEEGFDGVIDDNPADGLVIFNPENVVKVEARMNPTPTLIQAVEQQIDSWIEKANQKGVASENTYVYGKEGSIYLRYTYFPARGKHVIDIANVSLKKRYRQKGIMKQIIAMVCAKPIKTVKIELIHVPEWAEKVSKYVFPERQTIIRPEDELGHAVTILFEQLP